MTMLTDCESVCVKFGLEPVPAPEHLKLGIAEDALRGEWPLNGLRHPPETGTCGWFIWSGGDALTDDNYFEPIHVRHLVEAGSLILPYLSLPPGWRFQIAPGHEDVWFDPALLQI